MTLTPAQLLVWLVVGALAGNMAGRLVTFKKQGLGRWANLGVGMIGALIGGLLFRLFHIDYGLSNVTFTLQDLVAAFVGSLLFVGGWWTVRWYQGRKKKL